MALLEAQLQSKTLGDDLLEEAGGFVLGLRATARGWYFETLQSGWQAATHLSSVVKDKDCALQEEEIQRLEFLADSETCAPCTQGQRSGEQGLCLERARARERERERDERDEERRGEN